MASYKISWKPIKGYNRRTRRGIEKVGNHNRHVKSRIDPAKRRLFTSMAKQPYEVAGPLDFEKGELQNAKVHFGDQDQVEFEWDPDYEVTFHTHTAEKGSSIMPSYEDLITMKETPETEQVIFHKNIALSIAEKDKFQNISSKKLKKVSDDIQKDYVNGMPDKKMYNKYKPIMREELGLDMKWHEPDKPIQLQTRWE